MFTELIIILVVAVGISIALFFALRGPLVRMMANEASRNMSFERERMMEQLQNAFNVLEEKMKKEEQFIENKKDSVKEAIDKIHSELVRAQQQNQGTNEKQVMAFSKLSTVLEEHKSLVGSLRESTDNLRSILSNNQMRGHYGQEVAENLLRAVGFVKGQTYLVEQAQENTTTRPDFTILLPDKTKVNVDVKFPLDALLRFQESEKEVDKQHYLKQFTSDVKQKIKEVTTRDYINPEENTVDFVILFVPNEMVFSFIYDQLYDVWNEAMAKKVILAGPFSFTAILRMIFQAYRNFTYQTNIRQITNLFRQFEDEYEKYNKEVDTLGARIQSVQNQYQTVSVTRAKKLTSVVDKIRSADTLPEANGSPASILEEAQVIEE
ncbi:MAG: DNA recombination protein RmuC [Candidatus Spechtbacteria bacterium]|nr:DNA recombination protein RmuC [Candidatus Spechtbacteria bacterium]